MAKGTDIRVRLFSNSKEFNNEMSAVARQMKLVKSEFEANRTNINVWGNALKQSETKIQYLNQQLELHRRKVQTLKDAYLDSAAQKGKDAKETENLAKRLNYATAEMNKTQNELNKTTAQMEKFRRETDKQATSSRKFGDSMDAVGSKMRNIGASVGITAGIGFTSVSLAMKQAVNVAIDFERAMSEVKAISGASASEFKVLENKAKELGAATIFSASQAAEGMKYLALAGFKTNDIIAAMPGMLDLAAAGSLDLGRAADIVSDNMQAFGLSANKAGHAADVYAYAQANANTNVEQMGEAMKYLAPAAHSLGWTLEESAAATMSLANAGIKGSLAGQAFGTSLTRLAKEPTKKIKNAMDDLNFSFFDTEGHMKSLPVIIKGLENSMEGWTDKQKAATLITIFGAEAYKHWAVLLEAGSETIDSNTKALENADGAAKKMADTMTDNAYGKVVELQSAFEGLQITLSQHLMSGFEGVVQKATDIVRTFNNLDKGTQETIVKTTALGTAMLGVVGVVGTLTMGVGALMTFAGPVGLAITGITAGIGALGLAMYATHEHTENLKKKQEEARETALLYGDGVSKATRNAAKSYVELREKAELQLFELNQSTGKAAKEMSDNVIQTYSNMSNEVVNELKAFKQDVATVIEQLFSDTQGSFEKQQKEIEDQALASIDKDIAAVKKSLEGMKALREKYSGDLSKMSDADKKTFAEYSNIFAEMTSAFAKNQKDAIALQQSVIAQSGKLSYSQAKEYNTRMKEVYDEGQKAAKKDYEYRKDIISKMDVDEQARKALMSKNTADYNKALAKNNEVFRQNMDALFKQMSDSGKLLDLETGKQFKKQDKFIATATGYPIKLAETEAEFQKRWAESQAKYLQSLGDSKEAALKKTEKALLEFNKNMGLTEADAKKESKKIVDGVKTELEKAVPNAKTVGSNTGNTLNQALANTTAKNMRTAKQIKDEITGELGKTTDGGGGANAGALFRTGLLKYQNPIKLASQSLAEKGKEGLKSVKTEDAGQGFVSGFINSISVASTGNSIFNAAWNLGKTALSALKQSIDSHSPSKQTEKEGKNYADGFKEGIKKNTKSASASAKAMATAVQKAFNSAMDDAQYKFKMGKIDANGYIKELQKVSKQYAKTGDQIKKVNLEIEKARKDAVKKEAEALKKSFDQSKAYIDKKKQTNELALAEELAAWERVQARFKKGSKEREEAEQNVFRVKKEIHDKLTSLNDEYLTKVQEINQKLIDEENALNEEYRKAVEDRTNALYSFAGIFDEVSLKADVTGEKLVQNLVDQVNLFSQWATSIEELAQKGIDKGLLEELRQMGPKAAAEVIALNNMTDTQLEDFVRLWKVKNELARQQATSELEGLKTDTKKKIDELHKNANSQLEQLKTDWAKKIKEIRNGTTNEFTAMSASMSAIGKNTIQGLMNGMKSMEGPLMKQAQSIADSIASTIRKSLQVRSPSRLTYQIGEFVGQGLGGGMLNQVDSVMAAAKQLAKSAIPNVSNLSNIIGSAANAIRTNQSVFVIKGEFGNGNLEQKLDQLLDLFAKSLNKKESPIISHVHFHDKVDSPSANARKVQQTLRHLAPEWGPN